MYLTRLVHKAQRLWVRLPLPSLTIVPLCFIQINMILPHLQALGLLALNMRIALENSLLWLRNFGHKGRTSANERVSSSLFRNSDHC